MGTPLTTIFFSKSICFLHFLQLATQACTAANCVLLHGWAPSSSPTWNLISVASQLVSLPSCPFLFVRPWQFTCAAGHGNGTRILLQPAAVTNNLIRAK